MSIFNCYRCDKPIEFDNGALCTQCEALHDSGQLKCVDCSRVIDDYSSNVHRDYKRCVSCDQKAVDRDYINQELESDDPNWSELLSMDIDGSEF